MNYLGNLNLLIYGIVINGGSIPPPPSDVRITDDLNVRITDNSNIRIVDS